MYTLRKDAALRWSWPWPLVNVSLSTVAYMVAPRIFFSPHCSPSTLRIPSASSLSLWTCVCALAFPNARTSRHESAACKYTFFSFHLSSSSSSSCVRSFVFNGPLVERDTWSSCPGSHQRTHACDDGRRGELPRTNTVRFDNQQRYYLYVFVFFLERVFYFLFILSCSPSDGNSPSFLGCLLSCSPVVDGTFLRAPFSWRDDSCRLLLRYTRCRGTKLLLLMNLTLCKWPWVSFGSFFLPLRKFWCFFFFLSCSLLGVPLSGVLTTSACVSGWDPSFKGPVVKPSDLYSINHTQNGEKVINLELLCSFLFNTIQTIII